MANHVSTNVHFHRVNDEAKAIFLKMCERLDGWNTEGAHSFNMHEIFGEPEQEEGGPGTYAWNIDHMGAKWCHMEDVDEYGFHTESAWSVPYDGIEYILEQMAEADPNMIVTVDYIDEMPNFFGWAIWRNGWDEGHEWQSEEFEEIMRDKYPEIAEGWNEEEQEYTEEAREVLWENQWDEISDLQIEGINQEIQWILESEEEDQNA